MRNVLVVLAVVGMSGSASASDQSDVMAVVSQFVNGFKRGDTNKSLAICADEVAIIDDFPPFVWQGKAACSAWADDFVADARKNEITNPVLSLGKPKHVDISGDRAYLVFPADFSFNLKGKPTAEKGASLTVTLRKWTTGWFITGSAWAKH